VLTKDEIHIVINIVIANPTQANLFPQFCVIQKFAISNTTQAKKKGYHV
jgi:hypothetical protein